MEKSVQCEFVIDGKQYILSAGGDIENLNRVVAYINKKLAEVKKQKNFLSLDNEKRKLALELNIAEDYMRLKDEVTNAESDKNDKNNEIFELKHEILDLKDQLATAKKEISDLKKENFDAQKDIVRLETELEERAKRNIRTNIK